MLNSYVELSFDVLHTATGNRYTDGDNISLINLGPIALFRNYKLTTGSRKHLREFSHAHNVSSMYKLLTSSRDSDDLCIGSDRGCDRRRRELTNNKKIKGNYHV